MAEGTHTSLKESFKRSFDSGPKISISASHVLTDYMSSIKSVLSNPNEDWQNRVKHLKLLRSVVRAGGANHPDFSQWLRHLTHPMQLALNDLRSVVTREACITVAFLSMQLKLQFCHFAEVVFPNLVALIANSVKVISSCGLVTIDFLLQSTQSPRFIPIMTGSLSSKSNVTRRHLHAFLLQVTKEWPVALQQKHVTLLRDALVSGLHDGDKDARGFARKSFKNFCNSFPHEAKLVLSNLDSSIRHGLEQEFRESQRKRQQAAVGSRSSSTESVSSKASGRRGSGSSASGRPVPGAASKSFAQIERPKVLYPDKPAPQKKDTSLRVSQSQPNSREVSPSRRDLLPHRPAANAAQPPQPPQPQPQLPPSSRIPRSLGASAAAEPPAPSLQRNSDSEQSLDGSLGDLEASSMLPSNGSTPVSASALQEAIPKSAVQTREWTRTWTVFDSDDSMSETSSSMGSESSYSSHGFFGVINDIDTRTFQAMNKSIQEITIKLRSAQWTNRRDSLIQFRRLLINGLPLDQQEVKHMKRMLTRVFEDPSDAVAAAFLEALQLFVQVYHEDLYAWLPSLLAGLMGKHSQANQAAMQARIYETMHVIRNSFPPDLQWRAVCKLLVESSQAPTVKVKLCLLTNLNELVPCLSQHVLLNVTGSVRMAVSKIVSWTLEPKSMEVRRLSSLVLLALSDINDELFGALLGSLPRTFQEGAAKVLQNAERLRPPIEADETEENEKDHRPAPSGTAAITVQPPTPSTAPAAATPAPPLPPASDRTSTDSGIQSSNPDLNGCSSRVPPINRASSGVYPEVPPTGETKEGALAKDQDGVAKDEWESFSDDDMARILQELSNHNERHRERRTCLVELSNILQSLSPTVLAAKWDDYFKPTLLLLLETLADSRSALRCGALRTLRDLVRADPHGQNIGLYGELTLLRVLEAHGDVKKRVIRAAEDCAAALTDVLPCDMSVSVLVPIVLHSIWRITHAAIRLEMRIVRSSENAEGIIPVIAPGLIKACDHEESRIRKAAVFCIVMMHLRVGETVWNHFSDLSVGKIRLIKVYIQRARESEISDLTTSKPLSFSEP